MSIKDIAAQQGLKRFDDVVGESTEPLAVGEIGPARVLVLNNPRRKNALSIAMRRAIIRELDRAAADDEVRAVIVAGAAETFCSGVDTSEPREERLKVTPNPGDNIRAFGKPIIVAVDGVCMTGGLEFALGASFIIASERARFADTHAKVGIAPSWGMTAALPARIGAARALQLSLTGEFIGAERAFAWGLVNEVVPHEELFHRALELVDGIDQGAPWSVEMQLDLIRSGQGLPFEEALDAERASVERRPKIT